MKNILLLLVLVIVAVGMPLGAAENDVDFGDPTVPVSISADMLTYDRENNIYTAEGNVEITRGDARLMADTVIFYGKTSEAEASGNVTLVSGEDVVEADHVELNIDTQTGIIYNGMIFYADKHFYVTGEELEKTGESTYRILRGTLTSCDGDIPAWKITGNRSAVTLEGYAELWGGAFYVKNVPIFYIPYGIFPVKTKRQSGLLFPIFGYSDDDGARFMGQYFWAINKSMDATFTVDAMTKRGVKGGLEYRYFLRKDIKGQLNVGMIDDRIEDDFRYGISFDHRQGLPGGFETLWDVNVVSDDEYLDDIADFYDELPKDSSRYLESRGALWKEWYPVGVFLEASYFDDLKDRKDEVTLHRLPRLSVYTRPLPVVRGFPLYFDLRSTFVNFEREEGVEGQRLHVEPGLTLPVSLGPVSVTPWVQGLWTGWWLSGDDLYPGDMDRWTYMAGVDVSAYIGRTYTGGSGSFSEIRHVIKPVFGYTFSPYEWQGEYPYFDSTDRIRGTSTLTVALENWLLGKSAEDTGAMRELLYLKVGVDVDFDPDDDWFGYRVSGNHVSSFYELRSRPSDYIDIGVKAIYDHELEEFGRIIGDVSLKNLRGDVFSVGYTYEREPSHRGAYEQIGGSVKLVLYRDMDLLFRARYSFDDDEWRRIDFGIDYRRQCWEVFVDFYSTEVPDDFGVMAIFTLSGLGSIKLE
jgi:LPS-assembly protein